MKTEEDIKELILKEAEKGNIVYQDMEGLHGVNIDDFVKQPFEGQLYDLNRSPEVILTFINEPKWVNDYAMMLLLGYYYGELKEWKQKIQTALAETSNWNCKEVLTKLLED